MLCLVDDANWLDTALRRRPDCSPRAGSTPSPSASCSRPATTTSAASTVPACPSCTSRALDAGPARELLGERRRRRAGGRRSASRSWPSPAATRWRSSSCRRRSARTSSPGALRSARRCRVTRTIESRVPEPPARPAGGREDPDAGCGCRRHRRDWRSSCAPPRRSASIPPTWTTSRRPGSCSSASVTSGFAISLVRSAVYQGASFGRAATGAPGADGGARRGAACGPPRLAQGGGHPGGGRRARRRARALGRGHPHAGRARGRRGGAREGGGVHQRQRAARAAADGRRVRRLARRTARRLLSPRSNRRSGSHRSR